MVAITPPCLTKDQPTCYPSEPRELYDDSTARTWPRKAVDRFVVGRIHGSYSWTQICLDLSIFEDDYNDITTSELQRFWNAVLPRTNILRWWSSRTTEDEEVQKVLKAIEAQMNKTKEFFEKHGHDFDMASKTCGMSHHFAKPLDWQKSSIPPPPSSNHKVIETGDYLFIGPITTRDRSTPPD